jgi:hypothetical protein
VKSRRTAFVVSREANVTMGTIVDGNLDPQPRSSSQSKILTRDRL